MDDLSRIGDYLSVLHREGRQLSRAVDFCQRHGCPTREEEDLAYSEASLCHLDNGNLPPAWPIVLRLWRDALVRFWVAWDMAKLATEHGIQGLRKSMDATNVPVQDRFSARLFKSLLSIADDMPPKAEKWHPMQRTLPDDWKPKLDSLNEYVRELQVAGFVVNGSPDHQAALGETQDEPQQVGKNTSDDQSDAPAQFDLPTSVAKALVKQGAKELAARHNVPYDALRKRLERYRKKNLDCFATLENPRANEDAYIYSEVAVMHIIEKLKK